MDKFILKILLAFIRLFVKKDVDFERLKIIAETKVLMDRRRSPATFKQKQQKEVKNPLLFTLITYMIFGFIVSLIIYSKMPLLVSMVIVHSYLLFMMAMTLVTDFSSVLLDTTDNNIILPKPVTSRTLFLARVVHILVYLLQFTIALAIFPLVATFISHGIIAGLTTLILLPFTIAFSVFLTYLLYALILRFANEQKVKDIISYFQIFMTIFFAVGFQIIPRMIGAGNSTFSFSLHWYSYLIQPIWAAMATEATTTFNFDKIHLLMIACALFVPVLTVWLMIKYLSPSFSRKLGVLGNNTEVSKKVVLGAARKTSLSEKLSPIICKSPVESLGFEKVWKITGRDKNFRMQFYPSLAYLLVFVFVFVFKSSKNIAETWAGLSATKTFLFFVYLPIFSVSASLQIATFNDSYVAAWIYQSAPLTRPGEVISGMLKALLVKFFVPVYVIFFAFSFYVWGPSIVDDFIFGFFNNIFIFLLMANWSDHYLPFSRQPDVKAQTGKFVRMILQMFIIGVLIAAHYFALKIFWLPAALIPVSAVSCYFLMKKIQDLPWLKISI